MPWSSVFTLRTDVAFPFNWEPFHIVSTFRFSALNGPFQLTLSNSNGDRYIKEALQALGNIFGNQNSLALMRKRAREGERGRKWYFFQCIWKDDRQYICLLKSDWKGKNVYFSPFGHNLDTQGIYCPLLHLLVQRLQSQGGVGGWRLVAAGDWL